MTAESNPQSLAIHTVVTSLDGVEYLLAASQTEIFILNHTGEYRQYTTTPHHITTLLPLSPSHILAGSVGVLLESKDNGQSWETHRLPLSNTVITALQQLPSGDLICATLEDGVLCHSTTSNVWRGWNFGLLDWRVLTLAVTTNGVVYAGTETGLFCSNSGGRSWQDIPLPVSSAVMSLTVAADNSLWLGTENGHLLYSSDNGVSWTVLHGEGQPINALTVNQEKYCAVLSGNSLSVVLDGSHSPVIAEHITAVSWMSAHKLLIGTATGVISFMDLNEIFADGIWLKEGTLDV